MSEGPKYVEVDTVVRFRYRVYAEGECATSLLDTVELLTTKDDKIGAAFDQHVHSPDLDPRTMSGFDYFLEPQEGDSFMVLHHKHQIFDEQGQPMTVEQLKAHSEACEEAGAW